MNSIFKVEDIIIERNTLVAENLIPASEVVNDNSLSQRYFSIINKESSSDSDQNLIRVAIPFENNFDSSASRCYIVGPKLGFATFQAQPFKLTIEANRQGEVARCILNVNQEFSSSDFMVNGKAEVIEKLPAEEPKSNFKIGFKIPVRYWQNSNLTNNTSFSIYLAGVEKSDLSNQCYFTKPYLQDVVDGNPINLLQSRKPNNLKLIQFGGFQDPKYFEGSLNSSTSLWGEDKTFVICEISTKFRFNLNDFHLILNQNIVFPEVVEDTEFDIFLQDFNEFHGFTVYIPDADFTDYTFNISLKVRKNLPENNLLYCIRHVDAPLMRQSAKETNAVKFYSYYDGGIRVNQRINLLTCLSLDGNIRSLDDLKHDLSGFSDGNKVSFSERPKIEFF